MPSSSIRRTRPDHRQKASLGESTGGDVSPPAGVEDSGASPSPFLPWVGRIEGAGAADQVELRTIIEKAFTFVTVFDLEGRVLFLNRALPEFNRDQVIGSSLYDHVSPQFQEILRQVIRSCIETGRSASFEVRGRGQGGTTTWYRNEVAPLPHHGQLAALVMTSSDVTEWRIAAEALRESEERFRLIVENSGEAFLLYDEEARCYYANHVYEQIWGRSLESLYADPGAIRNAIHPEDKDRVLCSWQRFETRAPFDEQYRIVRPDGAVRWVWDRTQWVPGGRGQGSRIVRVIRDITDRKLISAQLSSQRELLDSFFSAAPSGMAIVDDNLRYVRVNESLARMNGVPLEEHSGKSIYEVIPRLADKIVPVLEQVRNTGKPVLHREMSGELEANPGVVRHFIASYFPVALGNGEDARGLGAVVVDVSAVRTAAEDARARARQQAAVAELGQRALAGIDLRTLMHDAVALVARTLEVECSEVLEFLPARDKLMARATVGPGQVEGDLIAVKAHLLAGYALAHAEPVALDDVATDHRFEHCLLFSSRGVVSGLTVIIHGHPTPYGILGAYASKRRKFSPDNVTFLQAMANVIAHSVERRRAEEELQQLSGQLLRLQDQERRRIARELHDSTSQNLAALAIKLGVLSEHVEPGTPAAKNLKQSVELVESCTREIRTVSYLLHPPMLDELGLAAAFRWYVRGFAERSGIKANLKLPARRGRFPTDVELTLYRILQEALANVNRHSGSPVVDVRLGRKPGQVVLSITDKGHGMPPRVLAGEGKRNREDHQLGVGLLGMRERVRQFGGTLNVASSARGTKVTATLPLGQPLARADPPATDSTHPRTGAYNALLQEAAKHKHVFIHAQVKAQIERLKSQPERMQTTLRDRHPEDKR